ncbi:hypothetical protein DFH09DRAFT_1322810 [Mycena vulgaris]|nr:hypothetical protein DFH09DRAFT_1322810 [Mycena vulgaris]
MLLSQFGPIAYPVLLLPLEITFRIFVLSLPSDRWLRPSPHLAPLLLAQICMLSRWIGPKSSSPLASSTRDPQLSHRPLKLWLSRAKTLLVSFLFTGCHPAIADSIADIAAPHCRQWEDIGQYMTSTTLRRLPMDDSALPSLREISIGIDDSCYADFPTSNRETIIRIAIQEASCSARAQ